jgi:tRNA-modifying protein YgfZ
MQFTVLPTRGLLAISGEDAVSFLQGLITNDANQLTAGQPIYAALLSPQGKYLHDFFLFPDQEKILADCEKERIPDLMQRLKMYRLRSKVEFEILPESMGAVAAWGDKKSSRGFADPRIPDLGYRITGVLDELNTWCQSQGWQAATPEEYHRMRIAHGIPDSGDMVIDRSILMYYGFEDLHGADFKKGCYVGQEIMARTKYRGQVRKFLYKVQADRTCPAPGTPIHFGEAVSGEMRTSSGNSGLAILRVEDVENSLATRTTFQADGISLTASFPQWVKQKPLSAAGE